METINPDEVASWTEERVERLKQLAAKGLSARAIAAELGGVTRNAVIGKMKRCQIPLLNAHSGRPSVSRKTPNLKERSLLNRIKQTPRRTLGGGAMDALLRRIEQQQEPEFQLSCDAIEPLCVGFLDLAPHHCRWPLDEKRDGLAVYCGHPREGESSYCLAHDRLAHATAAQLHAEYRKFKLQQEAA